ncbi:hypothetical protein TRV_01238 [Trichophyton verrucosum HKI 0517]|uniref:Uncharacterized protein n=1 Tax=Trichophyton verrucosum (strain HKI 0517) TaxID=663202 RepID=D4D2D3_TRIVH|nr:uncharacterized protein TRV_01238 [Trichophyton verrucosum HKI 0517]EFE43988.1 hypothetical protein TRV_01238 [Trichophyton verrucosum HKI 0517]
MAAHGTKRGLGSLKSLKGSASAQVQSRQVGRGVRVIKMGCSLLVFESITWTEVLQASWLLSGLFSWCRQGSRIHCSIYPEFYPRHGKGRLRLWLPETESTKEDSMLNGTQLHDLNDKAFTVLRMSCQDLKIALDMGSSAAHQQAMAKDHL